ncbi:HNH endonuclease [Latilactobacillus phage TMW 1.1397 P1]|nr:HNH endonuclease [Latilactobacillus phage TMW 1.1397 P1]
MKQRCNNPKVKGYKNWGGRGILVCDEWKDSFYSFYLWATNNGYNHGLTIDRIDVDGNYEPSNCRWVTMKVQANNKRNSKHEEEVK